MQGTILVKYVGKKAKKRDTVAGSRYVWRSGQTLEIPAEIANQLLVHDSVWVEGNKAGGGLADAAAKSELTFTPEMINAMNETELRQLVRETGIDVVFGGRESAESMRQKVLSVLEGMTA